MSPVRLLTYRFFDLPFIVQTQIVRKLGFYTDKDAPIVDTIGLFTLVASRIKASGLADLWDEIEVWHEAVGDDKYPTNPFRMKQAAVKGGVSTMKLILCPVCHDIVRLTHKKRYCVCNSSWGYYEDDGLNAVYGGSSKPLGLLNKSLYQALMNQPEEGAGECFEAFVIPKSCPTFKRVE